MPLDDLAIYQLRLPLAEPYPYDADAIDNIDIFVAIANHADGSCRLGESALLPLRGQEPADQAANAYDLLARHGQVHEFLNKNQLYPNITLPIVTCLDSTLAKLKTGQVALCPLLRWNDLSEIAESVAGLAKRGNRVARIHVPPSLEETKRILQEAIPAGEQFNVRFRYDVQGTLDSAGAKALVRLLDHPTTELLEQPLPADNWEALANFYDSCPVPLLLNIRDARQVFRAADCADYLKLTLAQVGSPARLLELIRQAREIGFKIILGSDTPGFFGSWLEGQIQLQAGLSIPGEMTGFRRLGIHPLTAFLDTTANGFKAAPKLSWQELARLLGKHCLRQWAVPFVEPDFIRQAG
jgi:Enolase C-terminal domain-like